MKLHNIRVESKLKQNKKLLGVKKRANPTSFKGYPGLTHTAKEISNFIPNCKLFIEPFAGLGRITKNVKSDKYILNDLSNYALTYLKSNFKNHTITELDYLECIQKYDSKEAFFFIDPPWYDEVYDVNPLTAFTIPCKDIYNKLKEELPKIKGKWIIAGRVDGPLKNWDYYHKEVKSKKNYLFGKKARTYLVSNISFKNYKQSVLF